jgi:hypothetical protein
MRSHSRIGLLLIGGVLALSAVSGFIARGALAPPEPAQAQQDNPFIYSAKFVCGQGQPPTLVTGAYFTAVNIHNPGLNPVVLTKRVVYALPERWIEQNGPYPPSEEITVQLGWDQAFEIDCQDIAAIQTPPSDFPYYKGFVVIRSPVELDVVAVNSTESRTVALPPAKGVGLGSDIDVVHVWPLGAGPCQYGKNSDGAIGNGTGIPGDDATVPWSGDSLDDCFDADDDGDGLTDGQELTGVACGGIVTDPGGDITYDDNGDGTWLGAGDDGPSWDTDGDAVPDKAECDAGTNPTVRAAADRTACNTYVQNVLLLPPAGDADVDGLQNGWEVCKWITDPRVQNTDGQGKGDCQEAMDVNGNGFLTATDAVLITQAFFGLIGSDGDFDINGNGFITNSDAVLVLQAYFGVKPCQ